MNDLAIELDHLEDHQDHDVDAILARAVRAAEAAIRAGDPVLVRRAQLVQADMRQRRGDAGQAARTFLEIRSWAEEHGCRPLLARSHFHLTLTFHYLGDPIASLEHAISSVELLEGTAPAGLRIVYLIRLANALAEMGSIDASRVRYQQAEESAAQAGDLRRQMLVLNNLAYTELQAGDVGQAAAVMDRMYAAARALNRGLLVLERDTIANVLIGLDRLAEAEQILHDLPDAPNWFEVHDLADAALTLAGVQRRLGALDRAQASLERCHRICADHAITGGVAVRARAEQAEVYAAAGDHRAAFEEYKRFHAASEELRCSQQEARARTRQVMFETAEARQEAERYREQARRDALTGLYNRRHVDEHVPQLLADSYRAGRPLTVALLDLDHFKRVNDTLSHEVGDRVLGTVAGLLRSHVKALPGGLAARLGGEEFLLVLPGSPAADAAALLDDLRETIAAHPWRDITGDLPVTLSVGLATSDGTRDDVTQAGLLAEADRALYAAKRAGRNRVIDAATIA